MARIWFDRPLPAQFLPLLSGIAEVAGFAGDDPVDPLANLALADAIVAGGRRRYDGALMERAPRLRVIARTGIGLDNVVIEDATARGIAVCNAPDAPTISTAEHAIALMFAVARQLKWTDASLARGRSFDFFGQYRGIELRGKRLGLVGLGRIGSHVAGIARGIGMEVVAFDPYVAMDRAAELGVTLSGSLQELLQTADVVSLHVPLSESTRNLINRQRLEQMKPGAILINVSRGGVVDEEDLRWSLDNGHLLGAGLDVFVNEPPPADHPLLGRDDVVVSPHIASATDAGKDRLWRDALTEAILVLQGKRPRNLVNPEVWPLRIL